MDGTEGPSSQSAKDLAKNLSKDITENITLWDERLSSQIRREFCSIYTSRDSRLLS